MIDFINAVGTVCYWAGAAAIAYVLISFLAAVIFEFLGIY